MISGQGAFLGFSAESAPAAVLGRGSRMMSKPSNDPGVGARRGALHDIRSPAGPPW